MFRRILLAIDGSAGSDVALSHATALARESSATVQVLHVNELVVGGRGVAQRTTDDAVALVADAVRELRAAGVTAGGTVTVAHYRRVPQRIAEVAHERSAEVIVLGSQRGGRLSRLFAHQVRERTMRLTALPVLTAPAPLAVVGTGGFTVPDDLHRPSDREPSALS